mmetsp:Transcript_24194/g.28027  ORF Transcript_24194/g.28027 Transcript_24194/m.28027 type:complete len:546 (+) Transcript_24194:149-1786(+)
MVSSSSVSSLELKLQRKLAARRDISSLRSLEIKKAPYSTQHDRISSQTRAGTTKSRTKNESSCNNSINNINNNINNNMMIDFSSNDYLGLAHSESQLQKVNECYHKYTQTNPPPYPYLGSTGSRLLSGNSKLAIDIENYILNLHHPTFRHDTKKGALLFNSGYDANLSILSSIPINHDFIIMDELVHNSLIMGIKMSRMPLDQVLTFRHNNVTDLNRILESIKMIQQKRQRKQKGNVHNMGRKRNEDGEILIVVESVYSMDGDIAPLELILDLAYTYQANVIVDEAHGLGVFGCTNICNMSLQHKHKQNHKRNNKETDKNTDNDTQFVKQKGGTGVLSAMGLESHPALLAAIYTFGKAAGCHGAVIIANQVVIQYLINYARPFVYSTSLPPHSLWTIKCAYDTFTSDDGDILRKEVFRLVRLFRENLLTLIQKIRNNDDDGDDDDDDNVTNEQLLLPSPSPIQAIMCRGNESCIRVSTILRNEGHFVVYPIRSPTVPLGQERIRIIIHTHNTEEQVLQLVQLIFHSLEREKEMKRNNSNLLMSKL